MSAGPTPEPETLERNYPSCRRQVDEPTWRRAVAAMAEGGATPFPRFLALQGRSIGLPAYLADLARLEQLFHRLEGQPLPAPAPAVAMVNPTLQLVRTPWAGLTPLLAGDSGPPPAAGEEQVLLWRAPAGAPRARPATQADLLALKLVVEERDLREVARAGGVTVAWLHRVLDHAAGDGLVLRPPTSLLRAAPRYPPHPGIDPEVRAAGSFTLQWHVTHDCDLHCRHCYDRSARVAVTVDQGVRLLDDLYGFCRERQVRGQVTFTGGNPLLLPGLPALYRAAAERGFRLAILGNPAPREAIAELVAIEPPEFFQVSLEGLREHDDYIRGAGHFDRTLAFLEVLRDLGVHRMVMLTLTRDNAAQVLPLGELLRGRADTFHWNRLSPVGEGARLAVVPPAEFREFLEDYRAAAADNPLLGYKDNLFNPLFEEGGRAVFGGCTGHGCGAAFNFLSVLPGGEAHACRKFPSPVGNVLREGIAAVYDSPAAARYRAGSDACRQCRLAAVCGGCLASTSGFGRDPFTERDPYCWVGDP